MRRNPGDQASVICHTADRGTRRHRGSVLLAARRAAAAPGRLAAGRRGRQDRADRPERHRQDHADPDHLRRPGGRRRRRHAKGGLGVMRQFVGQLRDDSTVRDLLLSVAPAKVRTAAAEVDGTELLMMEHDTEAVQLAYAQALVDWGDAGGYEYETLWDTCTVAAIGIPFEKAQWRKVTTLSGGEQKRLVLEALLRGPEDVLLLDEPDNYLDVPAKRWLEDQLVASPKTVLFVSPRPRAAEPRRHQDRHPGAGRRRGHDLGAPGPVHDLRAGAPGPERPPRGAAQAVGRGAREAQGAGRDVPAEGRLQRGHGVAAPGGGDPAAAVPGRRSAGGGADAPERADAARRRPHGQAGGGLHAAGADRADAAVRPRGLVRRAGRGARLERVRQVALPAAAGRRRVDPDREHQPVGDVGRAPVAHTGVARLGSRVRPGWFAQTHEHPALLGRTLLEILHRGDEHRTGQAARGGGAGARPLRAGAGRRSRPSSRCRAVSRRGSRSCCSSCPVRPCCCSTSRPTTSTWTPPRRWRRASTPSRGPSSR